MLTNFWRQFKRNAKISLAMAKVNFTLRIEGSYLGIIWYLLNPLAMFLIIILIKKHALPGNAVSHYEVYLLIGIIGFNFFKQALTKAIGAISSNTNYLKSINNIPPETLVVAGLVESIYSHFFDVILIIVFMLIYKTSLIGLLFYPIIFFFFIIFLLGFSFIFAVLGVYFKDFNNVWSIITQLLFFLTPIFYSLPANNYLYKINLFNPLFYFLSIARTVVIDFKAPPLWMSINLILIGFVSLAVGLLIFNKYKEKFSEQ